MGKLSTSQLPLTPLCETYQSSSSIVQAFFTKSPVSSTLNINEILTDSLLVEILQRLPCITVLKLKSVCKHWHSIISDPYFIQTFVRYHDQHCLLAQHSLPFTLLYAFMFWHRYLTDDLRSKVHTVLQCRSFQLRGLQLDFLPCFRPWEAHPIWVVASHKDLLVCCDTKMSSQSTYYICNPLTKQWVALPSVSGYHRTADTAIGFITSQKVISRNSYKLVRVPELDSHPSSNQCDMEVFCSETGEWRKLVVTTPRSFKRTWQFRPDAITFKNKLHWLVNGEIIVVFDPCESTGRSCRIFDLPSELNSQMAVCLGSCQENLKVSQITGGFPNQELVVWKLRDYVSEKWHLDCRIGLKEMMFVDHLYFPNLISSSVEVLTFHPSDSTLMYLRIDNQIVICNVGSGTLEVVGECLGDSSFSVGTCGVFLLMHPCWPSLIPLLPQN